jgi:hypothetical protein
VLVEAVRVSIEAVRVLIEAVSVYRCLEMFWRP